MVLSCPELSVFKSKYLKRSTAHYLQATDNKWKATYLIDNAFSEKELIIDISLVSGYKSNNSIWLKLASAEFSI